MTCYHHNRDLVYCSYCFAIVNNYYNCYLICPLCRRTDDLIIICFLCNKTYNILYLTEYCNYYSQYINKIIRFYKKNKLKKNIYKYSNILLDKYYNPKSKYIEYIVNNFDKPNNINIQKRIAYIDINNTLKFFKLDFI
jgi:hypothetical protein